MESGKSITPLDALRDFGCMRLGARIFQLKQQGYNIKSEMVRNNGKHFCKYLLEARKDLFV